MDTHEEYTPSESPETCRNALSHADYSDVFLQGLGAGIPGPVSNPVILSENKYSHIYIAIEIADGVLSAETLKTIASRCGVAAGNGITTG